MSNLVPYEIFTCYKKGVLDKETTVKYLKSYAENGKNENLRIEAVDFLGKMCLESNNSYKFLENLLISDSNVDIRSLVARTIIFNCLKEGTKAIRWLFLNEKKVECLAMIYKALLKSNTKDSGLLKAEMEAMFANNYIEKYDIIPKEAMGLKFAELSIGAKIINHDDFHKSGQGYAVFKAKNGYVVKLEIVNLNIENTSFLFLLSNLESLKLSMNNLRNIENLSNLINLKYLDLTANYLTKIPGLNSLKNLQALKVAWNSISELNDLEKLTNLIDMDLSHNLIEPQFLRKLKSFTHI